MTTRRRKTGSNAIVVLALLSVGLSRPAMAQGRGQGAIVIKDDAPVYAHSTGDKIEAKAPRGYAVAGITTIAGTVTSYMAETDNGRAHILFLKKNQFKQDVQDLKALGENEKKLKFRAFMNPEDLAYFTYECGCGEKKDPCAPIQLAGWLNERWNACFGEARDKKLAELKAQWEKGDSGAVAPAGGPGGAFASRSAEKALTNDDVVSLIKVGLDEALIVSKIRQAKAAAFDLSTEGIVALKKAGASNGVVDAMMKREAVSSPRQ